MGRDVEAIKNWHAAGNQGGHGSREPRDRNLSKQRPEDRRFEQQAVNLVPAFWRRVVRLEHEAENSEADRAKDSEAAHEPARADNDSRRQRQIHVHAIEQVGECRNHFPQDQCDHTARNQDYGNRVHHSRLYRSLQFDSFFDIYREALEDGVENTAGLAGGDHVGIEIVENLGLILHSGGEAISGFDVDLHRFDRSCKFLVVLSVRKNFQTLHKGHAGIDHDRKLPGENRNIFRCWISAELEVESAACFLFLSIQEKNLFASKGHRQSLLRIGDTLSRDRLTLAVRAFERETGHRLPPN